MKAPFPFPARCFWHVVLASAFAASTHGQVVADGATKTLNNVTSNITSTVTIGTNGSFTLLILTNAAFLTNSGNGVIGRNIGANSNSVRLTSANTRWLMSLDHFVGSNGAFNRLIVSNSARVENNFGSLGVGTTSSNNEATVTGAGSLWSNRNDLYVGYVGSGNRLVVTNGGVVANNSGALGLDTASDNNDAVVTGSGSVWTNRASVFVGFSGSGNRLTVTNNGALLASNNVIVGDVSGSVSNSLLLVAGGVVANGRAGFVGANADANMALLSGSGSRWVCGDDFLVGSNGSFNQLVVSNGAQLFNADGVLGQSPGSSNNLAWITGAGSLWTNRNSLTIGFFGSGSTVVISNGATLANLSAFLASKTASSNNLVWVAGSGSLWNTANSCIIGSEGPANTIVATNGGTVFVGTNLSVGTISTPFSNTVVVSGGNLVVTNAARTAIFQMHRGQLDFNGGLIDADRLFMTNSAGAFDFNGGLLITRGAAISNGASFSMGGAGTVPAVWDMRAGTSDHSINATVYVGSNASFNQLLVTNGATLTNNGGGIIGHTTGANSNSVFLSGAGSRWRMSASFSVGDGGAFNRLVVSNGAFLDNQFGNFGAGPTPGSNNEAIITGAASVWSNHASLRFTGSGNRLVVSNGAVVAVNGAGQMGLNLGSDNNEASVTGVGSLWSNQDTLYVGEASPGNRLVISDAGTVAAGNLVLVGGTANATNTRVNVDGGVLRVTNSANSGVLDVRRGTNVLNAGFIEVDRLLLTNTLGVFELNGGTLRTENTTNNNGRTFFVGNGTSEAFLNLIGNGVHSFASGLTVRSNALLDGSGTLIGTVTVLSGGDAAPGLFTGNIGKFVLNNPPVLQGLTVMDASKNGASLTNDQIQVAGSLTYGGRLVVSKVGPTALSAGDQFPLFSASSYSGSFSPITLPALGAGLTWTNKLLVNGSIQVLSSVEPKFGSVTLAGTNVVFNGSGGASNATYWVLASTNVALSLTNWSRILTNQFNASGNFTFTNAITPAVPRRFYILQLP